MNIFPLLLQFFCIFNISTYSKAVTNHFNINEITTYCDVVTTYYANNPNRIYCMKYLKNNALIEQVFYYNDEHNRRANAFLYENNRVFESVFYNNEKNRIKIVNKFQNNMPIEQTTYYDEAHNKKRSIRYFQNKICIKAEYFYNNEENSIKTIKLNSANNYKTICYDENKKITHITSYTPVIYKTTNITYYEESGKIKSVEERQGKIFHKITMYNNDENNTIYRVDEANCNLTTITMYHNYKKKLISSIAVYEKNKLSRVYYYDTNNNLIHEENLKKSIQPVAKESNKGLQKKSYKKPGILRRFINFFA